MTSARHTMDSPEWFTPEPFVRAARRTMGTIHLDPASSEEANRVVDAMVFYSEHQSGLEHPWFGNVFLNPPGGKVREFWLHLLAELKAGHTKQAIWIGYSLEQLQTLQNIEAESTPLHFPMCVPDRRIAFVENDARRLARQEQCRSLGKPFREKLSPTHANYITYIGPNVDEFRNAFRGFGQVRT